MLNKIPSWFFFDFEIVEIVIIPADDFFIELNWSQILKKKNSSDGRLDADKDLLSNK